MKKIVCLYDFSLSSENALRYANELAQILQARLLLFYNVPAPAAATPAAGGAPDHTQLVAQLEERNEHVKKLEEVKRRLVYEDPSRQSSLECVIKYGSAKENISSLVREAQADLVVVGNEDAEALQEIFAGSVAAGIIDRVHCPVLVIPEQASFKSFRKIVYAVDQIQEPYEDAGLVLQLAQVFGSEILLLHVLTKEQTSANATANEEVYALSSWRSHKHVSYHVIISESIEQGISQFTRENRVDMLVLGHHAENPWQHLLQKNRPNEKAYHTYLPVLFTHIKRHS